MSFLSHQLYPTHHVLGCSSMKLATQTLQPTYKNGLFLC